jgi:hypothetical protein
MLLMLVLSLKVIHLSLAKTMRNRPNQQAPPTRTPNLARQPTPVLTTMLGM